VKTLHAIARRHRLQLDASDSVARLYDDGAHVATVSLRRRVVRSADAVRCDRALLEDLDEAGWAIGRYGEAIGVSKSE